MNEKQNKADSGRKLESDSVAKKQGKKKKFLGGIFSKENPIYKKRWFFPSVGAIVVLIVAINVIGAITAPPYEEVKLSDMTVAEACEKAKAQGWKIGDITRGYDYSTKTDCEDTKMIITQYDYDDKKKEVRLQFTIQKPEQSELVGKTTKEVCTKLKDLGWTISEVEAEDGCESEEKVTAVEYQDFSYSDHKYKVNILTKKLTTSSSSSTSSNSSSSSSSSTSTPSSSSSSSSSTPSSSSSSSSSNSLCSDSYQKNLDTAKTAYELAQKNYDTYKSLGMDMTQYQTALDSAKNALDAAQKIYDTYCK